MSISLKQQTESELQRMCVKWFRLQYPGLVLFAIPNGGKRSRIEAAIMNGEGVVAGIPDLLLCERRGEWGGLFIEMKVLPNVPQPKQLDAMDKLVRAGYACQIAYTFEQFVQHVNDYLSLKLIANEHI